MEIKKIGEDNKRTTNTVTERLESVSSKTASNGGEIVFIDCVSGRRFSAFKNVWDAQEIDLKKVEPGTTIEVTYCTKEWCGRKYDNFKSVRVVAAPVAVPRRPADDGLSSEEFDQMMEEVRREQQKQQQQGQQLW